MGSVHYPRIYFRGYHYWNPNTVNNNDYSPPINTYDPPNAEFDWKYLKGQGVGNYEEIPPWIQKPHSYNALSRKLPPAEWGYFGGQQCGFVTADEPKVDGPFSVPAEKTLTSGYTGADGRYGSDPAVEPWVGQPVQISPAKLVDVNPMSFWSSQVFFDKLTLGGEQAGFSAPPADRMHSRFISTAKRNYNSTNDLVIAASYGAVFQSCFRKSDVRFLGAGGPLRLQIEAAFSAGAEGLMLRYCAYSTLYFQGSAFAGMPPGDRYPMLEKMGELYENYSQGGGKGSPPVSRAYSRVAGWIGLWMPGELTSVPGGRFLIPFDQKPDPAGDKAPITVTPSNLEPAQYQPPPDVLPNTDGPVHAPQALGPATVEVALNSATGAAERFTLDLGNAIPERDSSGVKADFGTVKLGLMDGAGNVIAWVSEDVPYDQAAYEKFGGLVDLPGNGISAGDLERGSFFLEMESGQKGAVTPVRALIETLVTARSAARGMYAEQPDPPFSNGDAASSGPGEPSTQPACLVHLRYRGRPPLDCAADARPALKLAWQAYDYGLSPYGAGKLPIDVFYRDAGGKIVPFVGAIDVPADGCVEVRVVSKGAAIPNLVFLPYSTAQGGYCGAPFAPPQASPVGIGSSYYTVVKCLPWDNALAEKFDRWLNDCKPTIKQVNQAVWDEVFRTYFYAFPYMDFISDPAAFQTYADRSLARTDPEIFSRSTYMPVTRTWSAGQRHIMVSYVKYLTAYDHAADTKRAVAAFARPEPEGMVEQRREALAGREVLGHG